MEWMKRFREERFGAGCELDRLLDKLQALRVARYAQNRLWYAIAECFCVPSSKILIDTRRL
jgi:hypothetical protein